MKKTSVKHLMNKDPVSIGREAPIIDAIRMMKAHKIGAMCVTEGSRIIGIFTERDLLMKVTGEGIDPTSTPLKRVMTRGLVVAHENDSAENVYQIMKTSGFRHVPVVSDEDKLVGIVSLRDFEMKPQALLVSSGSDDTGVLEEVLDEKGYGLVMACSGEESSKLIAGRGFNLIMIDFGLSGGSPLKVLEDLHSLVPGVPIVAVLAEGARDEDASIAVDSGARNFIIRPMERGEVEEVIQRSLASLEPDDLHTEAMRYICGRIRLEFPSRMQLTREIIRYVLGYLERTGVDVQMTYLAIDEAISNAIEHGNGFDESRLVCLEAEIEDDRCRITVRDQGEGFDLDKVPSPLSPEGLESRRGRGIFLMRKNMDEVIYSNGGTEVALTKNLRQGSGLQS